MGGGEVEAETMIHRLICYDLPYICILRINLLHSDWACVVSGDTIYYRLQKAICLGIPQFDLESVYR